MGPDDGAAGAERQRRSFWVWYLAAHGWQLSYVPEVVAHHHPARQQRPRRLEVTVRNALWTGWLRRPARVAARRSARVLLRAVRDRHTARGLGRALAGAPWVLRERRVSPPEIEALRQALERG